MNRNDLIFLGLVVIVPAVVFAIWSILGWISLFLSPCVYWGVGHQFTIQIAPHSTCSAVSQTFEEVLVGIFAVQGGIITAASVGFVGLLRSNRMALVGSSTVLFVESFFFIVDGLFILTMPSAVFLAVVAARVPRTVFKNENQR